MTALRHRLSGLASKAQRVFGVTPRGIVIGFLVGVLLTQFVAPRGGGELATSRGSDRVVAGGTRGSALDDAANQPGSTSGDTSSRSGAANGTARAGGGSVQRGGSGSGGIVDEAAGGVRGVTSDTIKIGVVYPRTENLEAVDPNNYGGDGVEIQEAVADRWRREGRLPVHGRKIKFVYYEVDFLNPTDQRNACVNLVQDQKVFAVIGAGLGAGRTCVAQEFHTPIIADDWGGLTTDRYLQLNAPYLFSTPTSTSRLMRNWAHFAHEGGYLKGKTIGFYYVREDGPDPDGLATAFLGELSKLGYKAAETHSTDAASYAGPDDQVAVQKFRAAGVDMALLVLGPRMSQFMQYADSQGYKPKYLNHDYILTTRDMHANRFPPSQFEGTYAMTNAHMGEWGSPPLSPESKSCRDNFTRFSGEEVPGPNVHYEDILITCDLSEALMLGLEAAGRNLTTASLIHGLETNVRNVRGALYGSFSFSPTKHDGAESWRTLKWYSDCKTATTDTCWKVSGTREFRPFWVP